VDECSVLHEATEAYGPSAARERGTRSVPGRPERLRCQQVAVLWSEGTT
jgi:hypothetical protein